MIKNKKLKKWFVIKSNTNQIKLKIIKLFRTILKYQNMELSWKIKIIQTLKKIRKNKKIKKNQSFKLNQNSQTKNKNN